MKKKLSNEKKSQKKRKNFSQRDWGIILVKIFLIAIILSRLYYTNLSKENSISLLAVSETQSGAPISGSIINLALTAKPGSGNIYVNLNTIEEIDTQISIINSNKIACDIFELDCENYDFYYEFTDSALVLKGPSASAAIAILTAKTIRNQPIDGSTVITGSLNSGGIIGLVGGIDQKVAVAKETGFDKVLIPTFSDFNKTVEGIEVVKVMDIVEAYNEFNGGENYRLEKEIGNEDYYLQEMEMLADQMCNRTVELRNSIGDLSEIDENSTLFNYIKQANDSFNSAMLAENNSNFYSMGSFCYNANINYQALNQKQQNQTVGEVEDKLEQLRKAVILKQVEISSDDYKNNIETINDFYVYLILNDRIEESKEFIEQANELEEVSPKNMNITVNQTNGSNKNILVTDSNDKNTTEQKELLLSYALERFYTVSVWENFINHKGELINFDESAMSEACLKINREITIRSELLKNYGYSFFTEDVNEQNIFSSNPFQNNYLCVYQGLELLGRMNTVLNSIGITNENQIEYTQKVLDFTQTRIGINSEGNFPLIPYMYYEYANDLYAQDNYGSSMLYSNYALAYGDLNIYLEKEIESTSVFNAVLNQLFENYLFWTGLLILLAFVGTGL